MADMKGCDRDYIAHKTKNIYSLVLYRKERKAIPGHLMDLSWSGVHRGPGNSSVNLGPGVPSLKGSETQAL